MFMIYLVPAVRDGAVQHLRIRNAAAGLDAVGIRRRAVVLVAAGALALAGLPVACFGLRQDLAVARVEAARIGTLVCDVGHCKVSKHCGGPEANRGQRCHRAVSRLEPKMLAVFRRW